MESQENSTWANAKASTDRRQGERKRFRALAELRLSNQQVLQVRTFDISVGGIGVVSSLNLKLETPCEIRVRSPVMGMGMGMDVLRLRARVTHSVLSAKESGFMLGLEFENLPTAVVNVIKQYVKTAGWMRG